MDHDKLIHCLKYCARVDAQNVGCDDCGLEYCGEECQQLCGTAAAAIETLQDENEKLRVELENYRSSHCSEGGCAAEKDRDLVIAENKKLRAELERVKVERDAYQVYFKDLSSKPDCNTCEKRNCDYRPKLGATVRVNCPLYSGPQKED